MKKWILRTTLFWITLCMLGSLPTYAGGPVALECEYLSNPLGVDAQHPRFSWHLDDVRKGASQAAFRVQVYSNDQYAASALVWESGKVESDATRAIYKGKPLQPFTRYYWRVTSWDAQGASATSTEAAIFETGMMDRHNWQGAWISDNNGIDVKPAASFRKEFTTGKTIRSARVYIAVAGLYELYLNGEKVGNHRLDPMYTRFDRRNLYVTYDVTKQLQAGNNAIGVMLGNGWYNHQSTAVWDFHKAPWRNRPAFCLDLRITYTDGSVETIGSGKDWKTTLGPVIFNSIYTAEHYDARLEQPGWATAGFDDSKWHGVIYRSAPSLNIVSQQLYPVENVQPVPAVSCRRFSDTNYVFDLGRNIAGVSAFHVSGPAGTVIRLKHGEQLYSNGHVDQSNIDVHYRPTDDKDPFQTDIFILSGHGEESFMPRFNYKGFQYVEVTSTAPVKLTKENLTGQFMHSAVPAAGHIHSSDSIINKIWEAANASYLSNLFGYPTDCPQREKNGWTGDAQIAIETGLYSFDAITIYEKWLADHRDEQQPNGVLPSIVPTDGWGYEWGNGPDWTSTIAIIPWNIYLFYGDTSLLSRCYENIKRYVDHITAISPSGLTTWGLGDWVPVKSKTPVELTSSCYYYADVVIVAKAAKLMGNREDEARYTALAQKIKDAFNAKYLDREHAIYDQGNQTAMCVPLYWGLVPDDMKARVAASLAERVAADQYHLDVGLLGTKAILNALSENGYADIAYRVAAQRTFPSWGWWIVNGATTLYENWDINAKSDLSRNHIMFGEVGGWLYKGLGGIFPDEDSAGFKHILLRPHFVKGLDAFEASHESPYGTITTSWKRNKRTVVYTVAVPAGATATVYFDKAVGDRIYEGGKKLSEATAFIEPLGVNEQGEQQFRLQSGTYTFDIK